MSLPPIDTAQSPVEKYREYLSASGKPTRFTGAQRSLIEHIFAKHNHFDPEQLYDELKETGLKISRATVYRTLTKLVGAGLLRRLDVGTRTFYEHDYGYPQHEHMVCDRCLKMIEFQHPAIEEALRAVASQHGFHSTGHTLHIRGTCAECVRARAVKRRLDLI